MRIFAAGLDTETNTFSPIPTGINDFNVIEKTVPGANGLDISEVTPFRQWQEQAEHYHYTLHFGPYAWASPAGTTTKEAYETLRTNLLNRLEDIPVDIVLLNLHGAMVAQGYDDCEGDLLACIRESVGPEVIVAAELDLHCHITNKMVNNSNILITYKEYPHTDVAARGLELFNLAVAAAEKKCKPTMALYDCKMVGMFPTSSPRMRTFINRMQEIEQQSAVLSVSFSHGFPFSDIAEAGAKLLVITDADHGLAKTLAGNLGKEIVSHRHHSQFRALPLEQAIEKAQSISRKAMANANTGQPVVVADQSDNPGAGAPGDATYVLRWLLDHDIRNVAMAIFYDPQVVALSISAGEGAELPLRLGGKMGVASGMPVDILATVKSIKKNYYHEFPQNNQKANWVPLGDTVLLHASGIDIVVASRRVQCFSPSIFRDLNSDVMTKDMVVVKSTQHFYAAFSAISNHIIYMAAPGAVSPIVSQISYKKMSTEDKYPWLDRQSAADVSGLS